MATRAKSPKPSSVPHTRAWLAFEQNLDSITHMLKFSHHEAVGMKAQASRLVTFVKNDCNLTTKEGQEKVARSLKRFGKSLETRISRFQTVNLWQVVMLVTCVEAYLQDVLTAAASVDPELMSKSEQRAPYADVIRATSVEMLANELRARWARGWLNDGGPTRWISRLGKMGARGYPNDLGPRLERFWGIRHVVVHAAGIATADFVKRHPGVVKAAGDHVRTNSRYFEKFIGAVRDFLEPTDRFFLARYPSMVAKRP